MLSSDQNRLGGEDSELKQIYLRCITYSNSLGHGLLLQAAETIGDAANYDRCFQNPIAIEPFIGYFQNLLLRRHRQSPDTKLFSSFFDYTSL
ncbi:MAG: hypothetical protein CMM63_02555 [Rhodospirillaceae bacterium]|nr:hypothetical protein [Rhodospirillaceae bacterium]